MLPSLWTAMDTPAAPWNFSIWGASKLLQNQFTGIVQAIYTSIDPEQKIAKLKAELQVQMVQHGSTNYSEATKCSGQVVDLLPVYYVNNTKEETTMKLSKLFVYFFKHPCLSSPVWQNQRYQCSAAYFRFCLGKKQLEDYI